MENENSRSDEEDYDGALDNDNGEDFEATIAEEELLDDGDYADELRDLEDEGEMSIEELRMKYGYPAAQNSLQDYEDEDVVDEESCSDLAGDGISSDVNNEEIEGQTITLEDVGNSLSGFDDDDEDYNPPNPWRRDVRIDQEKYQAEIPSLLTVDDPSYESSLRDDAILLWAPDKSGNMTNEKLDQYLREIVELRLAHEQSFPEKSRKNRDDEDALCALYRNNYDTEAAKKSFPFPRINVPTKSVRLDALSWDENEDTIFQKSIETHGKNFSHIRNTVLPYRNVGELVEYYYNWKMTPSYRIWRNAHYHHSNVVQPHSSNTTIIEVDHHEPSTP